MKKILMILVLMFSFISCDMVLGQLDGLEKRKKTDTLAKQKRMKPGGKLISQNKKYEFEFQKDSNLVLTDLTTKEKYWESGTANTKAIYLVINSSGTLKLRSKAGAEWMAPGSENSQANKLTIHNDGSLILYKDKIIIWKVELQEGPSNTTAELHFIGEANDFNVASPGGNPTVEIDGYPQGSKPQDISTIFVLSNSSLDTPTGYDVLLSKPVNDLIPSYISHLLNVSDDIILTIYYSIVINSSGGSCIIGDADVLMVYSAIFRGIEL